MPLVLKPTGQSSPKSPVRSRAVNTVKGTEVAGWSKRDP
jgi:hypothetical protein